MFPVPIRASFDDDDALLDDGQPERLVIGEGADIDAESPEDVLVWNAQVILTVLHEWQLQHVRRMAFKEASLKLAGSEAKAANSFKAMNIVDRTLVQLNLECPAYEQATAPVFAWLALVEGTVPHLATAETTSRARIDAVAFSAAKSADVQVELERYVSVGDATDTFVKGPVDYAFCHDDTIIGIIEAKARGIEGPRGVPPFRKSAAVVQLYLQLLSQVYSVVKRTPDAVEVKTIWGFLSDGAVYDLYILDNTLVLCRVRDIDPIAAFRIITFLLHSDNRDHLSRDALAELHTELASKGTPDETYWENLVRNRDEVLGAFVESQRESGLWEDDGSGGEHTDDVDDDFDDDFNSLGSSKTGTDVDDADDNGSIASQ